MSHWYEIATGEPRYTVPYADPRKGERATTLTDAKKLGLVPSVTTIIGQLDKPALLTYKEQQILDAVVKYPYNKEDGNEVEWRKAIVKVSKEHSANAAKRGTEIHDALEKYYTDGTIVKKEEKFIVPVIEFIEKRWPGVNWIAEQSFASPLGFGGKVDLHSSEGIVLDFKTKDSDDINKMKAYDGHHMQSAAYASGLFKEDAMSVERYNLFISTQKSGLLNLTDSTDFLREWGMFFYLMEYWIIANRYDPRKVKN